MSIEEVRNAPVLVHLEKLHSPEVAQLRLKFRLSQEEFAERFGLSLRTVQQWEQRRRMPEGPAKLLLRLIEDEPEAVERVVRANRERQSKAQ
jgi:putative transcriptional regulator